MPWRGSREIATLNYDCTVPLCIIYNCIYITPTLVNDVLTRRYNGGEGQVARLEGKTQLLHEKCEPVSV